MAWVYDDGGRAAAGYKRPRFDSSNGALKMLHGIATFAHPGFAGLAKVTMQKLRTQGPSVRQVAEHWSATAMACGMHKDPVMTNTDTDKYRTQLRKAVEQAKKNLSSRGVVPTYKTLEDEVIKLMKEAK